MILIIDFGSQYNQLITRRVREHHVYCEIEPPDISLSSVESLSPQGIILSGGPASVYGKNSPQVDAGIFNLNIPVLGICYGMHFMIKSLGGEVKGTNKREYGLANLIITEEANIFSKVKDKTPCWMSHGDSVVRLPDGFTVIASTENTRIAAVANQEKILWITISS